MKSFLKYLLIFFWLLFLISFSFASGKISTDEDLGMLESKENKIKK
ncbi:MAG: hypothetical protein ACYDIA_20235 [Candidatus Humimicrobiaceae bacterium]